MATDFFNDNGVTQLFAVNDTFLGRVVLQRRNGRYHIHVGSRDIEIKPTEDGEGERWAGGMGMCSSESDVGLWENAWMEQRESVETESCETP